jgi:hypothetical protein
MRCARGGGALATAAMLGAAEQPPPPLKLPPNTLLLLVAPWCAPCWSELARLEELAAAAAPMDARVLSMEDGPRARAMIAELPARRRWAPAANERDAVRATLWARTPGLPFSVATDGRGRICAERGGGLDLAGARALVRSCGEQP